MGIDDCKPGSGRHETCIVLENLEVYLLTYYLFIMLFVSGPGQYDLKEAAGGGGLMTTRQDRFRPIKSETPGPGSYEVGYMDRAYAN